jgi:hypothetical protein
MTQAPPPPAERVTVVSLGKAHTRPLRMPPDFNVTCPDIVGINYVRDPSDSRAYYRCVDGLPQNRYKCPRVTKLVMATPPKCLRFPNPMP